MKEPKKIKLNPENPIHKEPIRYPLKPIDISGQDNDDMYTEIRDLDSISKQLDETDDKDNSKNH